ncbi:response regulator transcription factor [Evansella halocellulosilytica]|uniref:response regulator transcription factor n=1 Tax=Evansella halocellulosilytica TaxID=2011013 RepID=UPI0015C8FB68|nr:LuxR C-terminal-related transcriptional regulator [Evansella halocellulosilytica]
MITTTNEPQVKTEVRIFDIQSDVPDDTLDALRENYEDIHFEPLSALIHNSRPCDLLLLMVHTYDRKTVTLLEKLFRMPPYAKTRIILVIKNVENKSIFTYLNYPIDGLVTQAYLNGHLPFIIKIVKSNEIIVDPQILRELAFEIERKKVKNKPIEKLVLKREALNGLLNENEQNVLQLILEGHNNRVIAEKLFLAPSTVSTIITHMLRKVGASDRTETISTAIRRGWVEAYR